MLHRYIPYTIHVLNTYNYGDGCISRLLPRLIRRVGNRAGRRRLVPKVQHSPALHLGRRSPRLAQPALCALRHSARSCNFPDAVKKDIKENPVKKLVKQFYKKYL